MAHHLSGGVYPQIPERVEPKIAGICFLWYLYTSGPQYDAAAAMLDSIAVVNIIWFLLALCFLTALCLCEFSLKLPHSLERVFQDLIRYGKTKEHIKRSNWQLVFDISKR